MADPRPTQAEVEAMAEQMFGPHWKTNAKWYIELGDRIIAQRLDAARAAVLEQRR